MSTEEVLKLGARRFAPGVPAMLGELTRARHGLAVAVIVGAIASYVASLCGVSALIFAIAFGMGLNFLRADERYRAGIEMASKLVLRTGVALLGLRITLTEVASLGWATVAGVVAAMALTMGVGIVASRRFGLGERFGILSAGAVSICGASAALAISSVLPRHEEAERDATFVVISVTALSTVAMFAYPLLARFAGLDDHAAGVFFGGTIHDVAQVVGAGYSVSEQAGAIATIVKLLRVAMLLPICVLVGMVMKARGVEARGSAPILPRFAVVFAILVLMGSAGWIPHAMVKAGTTLSTWMLVIAMAAIGMKTSLRALGQVGGKAVMLVVGETVFLGALALGAIVWAS